MKANRKYRYVAEKTNMCPYCLNTFPSKFDMISHIDKEHKDKINENFKKKPRTQADSTESVS